jgi:hypothetical protein
MQENAKMSVWVSTTWRAAGSKSATAARDVYTQAARMKGGRVNSRKSGMTCSAPA